jgi:large subunit ribosomal protein L35
MPKVKTHKSAKDRLKLSATGKVMARHPGKRHLNWHKSGNSIRNKGRSFALPECEARRLRDRLGDR